MGHGTHSEFDLNKPGLHRHSSTDSAPDLEVSTASAGHCVQLAALSEALSEKYRPWSHWQAWTWCCASAPFVEENSGHASQELCGTIEPRCEYVFTGQGLQLIPLPCIPSLHLHRTDQYKVGRVNQLADTKRSKHAKQHVSALLGAQSMQIRSCLSYFWCSGRANQKLYPYFAVLQTCKTSDSQTSLESPRASGGVGRAIGNG